MPIATRSKSKPPPRATRSRGQGQSEGTPCPSAAPTPPRKAKESKKSKGRGKPAHTQDSHLPVDRNGVIPSGHLSPLTDVANVDSDVLPGSIPVDRPDVDQSIDNPPGPEGSRELDQTVSTGNGGSSSSPEGISKPSDELTNPSPLPNPLLNLNPEEVPGIRGSSSLKAIHERSTLDIVESTDNVLLPNPKGSLEAGGSSGPEGLHEPNTLGAIQCANNAGSQNLQGSNGASSSSSSEGLHELNMRDNTKYTIDPPNPDPDVECFQDPRPVNATALPGSSSSLEADLERTANLPNNERNHETFSPGPPGRQAITLPSISSIFQQPPDIQGAETAHGPIPRTTENDCSGKPLTSHISITHLRVQSSDTALLAPLDTSTNTELLAGSVSSTDENVACPPPNSCQMSLQLDKPLGRPSNTTEARMQLLLSQVNLLIEACTADVPYSKDWVASRVVDEFRATVPRSPQPWNNFQGSSKEERKTPEGQDLPADSSGLSVIYNETTQENPELMDKLLTSYEIHVNAQLRLQTMLERQKLFGIECKTLVRLVSTTYSVFCSLNDLAHIVEPQLTRGLNICGFDAIVVLAGNDATFDTNRNTLFYFATKYAQGVSSQLFYGIPTGTTQATL